MPHRGQEKGTSGVYTTYAQILLGCVGRYLMHWDQSVASDVMQIHAGGALIFSAAGVVTKVSLSTWLIPRRHVMSA